MPFRSQQQKKWMYATHPKMAARWEKETPKGDRLPKKKEHISMDDVFEGKKKAKKGAPARQPGGEHAPDLECVPWHMSGLEAGIHESGQALKRLFGLDEALNPGQLHDPKDFVQKLRELSAEVSSQCAMLEQFVDAHKGDPEWKGMPTDDLRDALRQMIEGGETLADCADKMEPVLVQKERAEEEDEVAEGSPTGYGGGPLFKR